MTKNKFLKLKTSSFIEGTLIATLGIIITKILGMLYVIPFYHLIGEKGSALYAYAYNIYIIFLSISTAGIPIAISKIVKEYQTLGNKIAKTRTYYLGIKLILIISLIIFIFLFIFAQPIALLILGNLKGGNTIADVTFVIRFVSFALLIIPFLSISRGYLQGHNIMNVPSISQIIEQTVRIVFILLGSYLSLKIFHFSLKTTVGIAVFGAFIGGIVAILYLFINIKKHQKFLDLTTHLPLNKSEEKEIIHKIIRYAIPFIIIDIGISLYNFVDMVFISRTMTYLGYAGKTTEFITTSIVTWANKINMIVNAIAVGLTTSLIPNIVEAYTLKKWPTVEKRLNKALQIIFISCIPMVLGISLLADAIWSIFYGASSLGAKVLKTEIFTALVYNLNTVSFTTLQSTDKFKTVYKSTFIGYLINACLDIPLMLLFHKINILPFYGAILASIIGLSISTYLALKKLSLDHNIHYQETKKLLAKLFFPTLLMVTVITILKKLIPYCISNKISCIFYVAIISLIGFISYILPLYKNHTLEQVFGQKFNLKKIKKLTLKK